MPLTEHDHVLATKNQLLRRRQELEAEFREKLQEIDDAIAGLGAAMRLLGGKEPLAMPARQRSAGIAELVREYLSHIPSGEQLTASAIREKLLATGKRFNVKKRSLDTAIHMALKREAIKGGLVYQVKGRGFFRAGGVPEKVA